MHDSHLPLVLEHQSVHLLEELGEGLVPFGELDDVYGGIDKVVLGEVQAITAGGDGQVLGEGRKGCEGDDEEEADHGAASSFVTLESCAGVLGGVPLGEGVADDASAPGAGGRLSPFVSLAELSCPNSEF